MNPNRRQIIATATASLGLLSIIAGDMAMAPVASGLARLDGFVQLLPYVAFSGFVLLFIAAAVALGVGRNAWLLPLNIFTYSWWLSTAMAIHFAGPLGMMFLATHLVGAAVLAYGLFFRKNRAPRRHELPHFVPANDSTSRLATN